MELKEICIEKVVNGFIIECEYKKKEKGIKATPSFHSEGRNVEFIATNEKEVLDKVKELISKLSGGIESGES